MVFNYKFGQQQSPAQPEGWCWLLKKPVGMFLLSLRGYKRILNMSSSTIFSLWWERLLKAQLKFICIFLCKVQSWKRVLTGQNWIISSPKKVIIVKVIKHVYNSTYEHLTIDLSIGSLEQDWRKSSVAIRWKIKNLWISIYSQTSFFLTKLRLTDLIYRHFRGKLRTYF